MHNSNQEDAINFHFWPNDFIGKFVLIGLIISSIYIWAVIIKKILYFMNIARAIRAFKDYVYKMPKLKPLIADDLSMHFQVYDAFLKLYSSAYAEENKINKQNAILEEIIIRFEYEAEANLNYLSIIGSISPFVGLFGTVFGIMHSLQSIANSSSTSIAIVAPGISEALFATAVGLCVAIPAAIATHLFYEKIEKLEKDVRIFAIYLINRLESNV